MSYRGFYRFCSRSVLNRASPGDGKQESRRKQDDGLKNLALLSAENRILWCGGKSGYGIVFYLVTVLFIGQETVFWSLPFATRELCIQTRAESVLVSTRSGSVVSYCTDKRPREDGSDLLVERKAKPARRK